MLVYDIEEWQKQAKTEKLTYQSHYSFGKSSLSASERFPFLLSGQGQGCLGFDSGSRFSGFMSNSKYRGDVVCRSTAWSKTGHISDNLEINGSLYIDNDIGYHSYHYDNRRNCIYDFLKENAFTVGKIGK